MEGTLDTLRDLASRMDAVVADAFGRVVVAGLSDDDLIAVMGIAGKVLRGAQALIAETAGEVDARSSSPERAERMTARYGCRTTAELVARVTRLSGRSAIEAVRVGRAVSIPFAAVSGAPLIARYPAMRSALADSVIGVDGVAAITVVLDEATTTREHRLAADAELAASARGEGHDAGRPRPTCDDLKLQARVWAAYLDPDGAEPRDELAQRYRGISLGRSRDGLVPISGHLLPEVAAQLQRLFDAILNPKVDGPQFAQTPDPAEGLAPDPRTSKHRRHDAFGTIVTTAARSGEMPTLGGAAPTLVVSVRAEDLAAGTGVGHVDGIDEPVPLAVVRHVGCFGGIYKVTVEKNGKPKALEVIDRTFSVHQRRVITLRDGGCIIPGCHVPAAWCEIHHVVEHAKGGRTSVGNGVLLGPRGEGPRAPRSGVWGSRGDAGTTIERSIRAGGASACATASPKCKAPHGGILFAPGDPSPRAPPDCATVTTSVDDSDEGGKARQLSAPTMVAARATTSRAPDRSGS